MNEKNEVAVEESKTAEKLVKKSNDKISKEDLSLGGDKESALNSDSISELKSKSKSKSKGKAKPSFFVKKDSKHKVVVDVLTSQEDGRVLSVSKSGLGLDFETDFPFVDHTELTFEFSIPNYEDMSTYRQRSTSFRRDAGQMVIDKAQLRNHLLVWHLKGWTVPNENGEIVKLSFDASGALSDESTGLVYAMSPTLLDVVMTWFEKDVLLV